MAIPIQVGDLCFKSKKAAKDFLRNIRDCYKAGDTVSGLHHGYLLDMVAIHHESDQKKGCGINYFSVELDPEFRKNLHFVIHRSDGSVTDVSFILAIDGQNLRRDRLEGLRRSIEDQVIEFRDEQFAMIGAAVCPITDEILQKNTCHVDHVAPKTFLSLVDEWMDKQGLVLDDLEITPSTDNQIVTKLTNMKQQKSWQTYHRDNCNLRILSSLANLSIVKG